MGEIGWDILLRVAEPGGEGLCGSMATAGAAAGLRSPVLRTGSCCGLSPRRCWGLSSLWEPQT